MSAPRSRLRLDKAAFFADLGMPVDDGFSLIRDIRDGDADVPAIALSANADQVSRDALAAGFSAVLAKPTRADTLLQLVRTLLEH